MKLFSKNKTIDNQKRDLNGKFMVGSGGFNLPKNFNWSRALPVILIVALAGGFLVYRGFASPPSNGSWALAWSDEFNGTSVDTTKWNIAQNSTYGSGNRQDECNRAGNVGVGGGTLNIVAKRETVTCGGINPDTGNKTYYFTSGLLTTRAQEGPMKYKFKQGYTEARIKTPRGNPYWPAFWLVSPNDGSTPAWPEYGEFDVYEGYGSRPDISRGTFHYKCTTVSADRHCKTPTNAYNLKTDNASTALSNLGPQVNSREALDAYSGGIFDYVVYGFEWDTNQITWYVNGRKVRFLNNDGLFRVEANGSTTREKTISEMGNPTPSLSTIFAYDHSILLNLAIGGNGPRYVTHGYTGIETPSGYSDGNLTADFPSAMQVDYVRVYKKNTSDPIPIPEPTPVKLPLPTNFAAVPKIQSVELSWNQSADTRVASYATRYIKSSSTIKADPTAWTYPESVASTNLTISGLEAGVSYDFQITANDVTRSSLTSGYTPAVQATPLKPTPIGLSATYYTNTNLTGEFVTRIDQTIDFDWAQNSPAMGIGNNFSARWTGQIVPTRTDTYTFTAATDDGTRLWVNGKPIIDSWKGQALTENSGTIRLEAGKTYDFDMDYFDTIGLATARLYWQTPTAAKQIVPGNVFRPTVKNGLSARFSGRGDTPTQYLLRTDASVNFNWGDTSPNLVVPSDNFRGNWIGKLVVPTTGTYTITTASDDGVGLWINQTKLIDDWMDHATRRNSKQIALQAGKQYSINLQYYENQLLADVKLLWSGPGIPESVIPSTSLRNN